jgi:DNA-binding NarL/FixJ family response regulator
VKTATALATIRVVVLGPHAITRSALHCLLNQHPDLSVLGDAERLDQYVGEGCDVFLVDIEDGQPGLALISDVVKRDPSARVLALANGHDAELHSRAMELGAVGVVLKDQTPGTLFKAIHKVNQGEIWLARGRGADVLRRVRSARGTHARAEQQIASLTRREREIIEWLSRGLKNVAIAQQLFISEATVRNHLTSILDKLELSNRFELVVFAFRRGLVECVRDE